jgi:hypothetical protein
MIAVWLLVMIAAPLPDALAMNFLAPQPVPPAGCHHHGPAVPSPAPANFQCCVSGHHVAVPSVSFASQPLVELRWVQEGGRRPRISFSFFPSSLFIVPSDSPPGAAPLRI